MIAYLKGKVVNGGSNHIILDVNGIGYKIFTTKFPPVGSEQKFLVHEVIREEIYDLYGFQTEEELGLFEKLLSVNGVGPKAALSILSYASSDQIISSIATDDISFFQGVPGVGKKVAGKIILELKSKLTSLEGNEVLAKMGQEAEEDVVDALVSLGYKKQEAQKVISKLPKNIDQSEEKVRWCLKNIS